MGIWYIFDIAVESCWKRELLDADINGCNKQFTIFLLCIFIWESIVSLVGVRAFNKISYFGLSCNRIIIEIRLKVSLLIYLMYLNNNYATIVIDNEICHSNICLLNLISNLVHVPTIVGLPYYYLKYTLGQLIQQNFTVKQDESNQYHEWDYTSNRSLQNIYKIYFWEVFHKQFDEFVNIAFPLLLSGFSYSQCIQHSLFTSIREV